MVIGDFNMAPKELEESGMLQCLGMSIIHDPRASTTCRLPTSDQGENTIDFMNATVVTTVDTMTVPLSEVSFPSVVVCNINQVHFHSANFVFLWLMVSGEKVIL